MARNFSSQTHPEQLPIQPVTKRILFTPFAEPDPHWIYDKRTGDARQKAGRRPASYWYKTQRTGSAQLELLAEEERDNLPLINLLREDVKRWRETSHRNATPVTRQLLAHWSRADRPRRLFFCQIGRWAFHACKDPQRMIDEIRTLPNR